MTKEGSPERTQNKQTSPEKLERDRVIEEAQKKRSGIFMRNLSRGFNFVPVLGGVKMAAEAAVGSTLERGKMSGTQRLIHGAVGVGSIILDASDLVDFGAGTVEGEGLKVAGMEAEMTTEKVATVLEKTSSMLAERGQSGIAKIFLRTGRLIRDNPKFAQKAVAAIKDYKSKPEK